MTQADGWVVVAWYRDPRSIVPPYDGEFEYDTFKHLNDAFDRFDAYERGEWQGYEARGIFATKDGLPFGPPLPLSHISAAIAEGRRDDRADAEHARHFTRPSL